MYIMCLLKCVYECLRGYCTFSLAERAEAKLICCGTSQSAAFFPLRHKKYTEDQFSQEAQIIPDELVYST